MRYRAVVLTLLLALPLPLPNVLPAPAPDPSAIVDIGPPPKGQTVQEYCKREIDVLNSDGLFCIAYSLDPGFSKLPAVDRVNDPHSWLVSNLRVKEEDRGRRLRLTLRAGTRSEQAIIINGLLRAILKAKEDRVKYFEDCIRSHEESIAGLERRIKLGILRDSHDSYREGINKLRSIRIPECRAEIARLKQITVVKWAK